MHLFTFKSKQRRFNLQATTLNGGNCSGAHPGPLKPGKGLPAPSKLIIWWKQESGLEEKSREKIMFLPDIEPRLLNTNTRHRLGCEICHFLNLLTNKYYFSLS
jgi:hypothetical protein